MNHLPGAIDSGHVRKVAHHAGMPLTCERVFVVERRATDFDLHVSGRKIVCTDLLNAAQHIVVVVASNH